MAHSQLEKLLCARRSEVRPLKSVSATGSRLYRMLKKHLKKQLINLNQRAYRKHVQHYVDCDYIDRLSPEEMVWMSKFLGEYYNNNVKKDDEEALHDTDELRRDCYNRANARDRDVMNIRSYHRNQMPAEPYEGSDPTDEIIEYLDSEQD